jgi:plastocyanin
VVPEGKTGVRPVRANLALLVAGCLLASNAATPAVQHTVTIEGMQFNPPELTVHRGERIMWVNKDLFPHTATATDKAFDSGSIAANASWAFTPSKPGDHAYSCSFHPTMKGMIKVQ